jgi:hypothetical protein
MLEVEASYSATSIRSYGEGSSGEGRNARARRDGRQHRKHDCWFQRDGAPIVTSLKLEEAKDVQRPKRLCQISTLAVTLERRPADQLQPILQSWEAGNISVDWGHHVTRSRSQEPIRGIVSPFTTHSPIYFQIFWKYEAIGMLPALFSSRLHSSFICLK